MTKLISSSQDDSSKYQRVLLAGRPKVGKTLLAATWPSPLIINADRGLAVLAHRGIKVPSITLSRMTVESKDAGLNSWLDVHEIIQSLISRKGRWWDEIKGLKPQPQTLVIDSLSSWFELLEAEIMAKPVIKDKKAGEQWLDLKDYGIIQNRGFGVINSAKDLPMHLVCTCGVKTIEDKDSGRTYEIPALTGTAIGERVAHLFNDVLLLYSETDKDASKPRYYATPLPQRTTPYVGVRTLDIDGPVLNPTYEKLIAKGKK
jgi:hypothetical protein